MTRTIPNYLKLHIEEAARGKSTDASYDRLVESFAAATGWALPLPAPPSSSCAEAVRARRSAPSDLPPLERVSAAASDTPPLELARVKPLAAAIHKVVTDLERAQRAVAGCEAELAAALPGSVLREDSRPLALRLESLLRTVAQSVQTRAAAAYLLDEATSRLKLRAHFGLPLDRLFGPARSLRGQAADLEALLGRAVVMNDTRDNLKWKTPEPCGAALCVPIASPSTPLGTLWLFADEPRDFSQVQVNLAEVVAGRIAAELERHAACRENYQMSVLQRQWKLASRWMRARVPLSDPLAEGWEVGGWTPQTESLSGQFIDWEMLTDGRIVATLGRAPGVALDAGLSAVTLHTLVKSLVSFTPSPRRLISRVNDTAWRTAAGNPLGSLIHASLMPETGDVELVATGDIGGLVIRREAWDWIAPNSERLGESPDISFRRHRFPLAAGETLLLLGAGLSPGTPADPPVELPQWLGRGRQVDDFLGVRPARFSLEAPQLAELVRSQASAKVGSLVDGIRLLAEKVGEDQVEPTAILAIRRRLTP